MDWEEMYGKKKSRLLALSCFDNGHSDRLWLYAGRKERNENMGNFNTRENVIEFIRGDKQMTVTDPKGEFFVSNFLKKSQMDIKEKSFEKFMKSRRKERNE